VLFTIFFFLYRCLCRAAAHSHGGRKKMMILRLRKTCRPLTCTANF
jgi:hypothetical protein